VKVKQIPANGLQFLFVGKSADIKRLEKYGAVTEKQIKTILLIEDFHSCFINLF
jgi:hypothetical protein